MNNLATTLLEAHIEHELSRFKNGAFKQTVEEEVKSAFLWIKDLKLKDFVTPEMILGHIDRIVVKMPIPGGVPELAGETSRKVLTSSQNNETTLEDIILPKMVDDIVDKAVSLENARNELIHHVLSSSAYSYLISEVMYDGIKQYIFEENIFAQKLPGISSMIKMGRAAVSKAAPKLEAKIENQIKKFIESNIQNTVEQSEKFLTKFLDEDRIYEMGDEIWGSIKNKSLAYYFNSIDVNDMEDFIIIGYEYWLNFRKTKYFREIYKEIVYFFFEKYADKEIDVIIEDMAISKEMIIHEVNELILPGIETALETGYLEQRIRARLSSFYLSETVASLTNTKM
ncbi:MAG: hypothetical protein HQK76_00235 [Desulfobacterales bacterium]|nr:hypothetical protein [Desulfobacterales bacterium]